MKRTPLRRKTPLKRSRTPLKSRRARSVVKNDAGATRKIWTSKKADDEFSLYIRERDGRCMYPGCTVTDLKKLQCSHYHGRGRSSTRYDPQNCIALCWLHHFKDKQRGWEYQKQTVSEHGYDGKYTLFMKSWLGTSQLTELYLRSKQYMSRDNAIIACMKLLKAL